MRLFIAVDIDDEIRKSLNDIVQRLKKGIQFTSASPAWVPVENMHITLKFLGETDESMLPKIKDVMNNIALNITPFEINFEKLGVFPNRHAPKILWTGINNGKDILKTIQQNLEYEMNKLGFDFDDRDFSPHLTLARIKNLRGTKAMMDVVTSHSNFITKNCSVKELILFQSVLHKTGPEYTKLYLSPFYKKS